MVIKIESICKGCGKPFEYEIPNENCYKKLFCNPVCSHRRIVTKESNIKRIESLRIFNLKNPKIKKWPKRFCNICKCEISFHSKSGVCKKHMHDYLSVLAKKLHKEGKIKSWKSRNILSYPEKFFITVLKNNNLSEKCLSNYPISFKDLGLNKVSGYFLDFYFPEKKLDLEIDGKQHLADDRLVSDFYRDKLLKKNGIAVYRIKWKNPINDSNKEYIREEIEKFLTFYRGVG